MLAGVCTRTVVRVNTNSTYETFHKEHVQSLGYGRQRLGRDGSEVAEIENSNFVESPSYKAAQTLSRSVTSERHLSGVHVIEGYKYENITTRHICSSRTCIGKITWKLHALN
jgi:hypothetical protein